MNKHKQRQSPLKKNGKPVQVTSKTADAKKAVVLPKKTLLIQRWIIFLFAIMLYANTLDLDYCLDDTLMITQNEFTKKGVEGIGDIFTNDAFVGFLGKNNLLPGGRYRPLSQVIFAIEYEVFGFNPFVGHLINIIAYAFLCLFLFNVLRKLFAGIENKEPWQLSLAFITTLLFTAHPLHTEVVANIKGLDEILCLISCLAVLWLTIKYLDTRKLWQLALACVVFLLAILSKESAITFIAIVPLILWFFRKPKATDYFITQAPLLLAMLAYFIIRISTIGLRLGEYTDTELLNNPFVGASFGQKTATVMYTWLKYLQLLIFPNTLTHDYYPKQIPIISWSDFRAIISLLIYLAIAIFALIKLRKKRILSFAILFFFVTFSIVSNLLINIGTFMNERFMFTALFGFSLTLGWAIHDPLRRRIKSPTSYSKTAMTILLVILAGYSIRTITRNRAWKDDLTLFTTDVKVSTNSTKCNTSAGGKLIEKADSTDNPQQKTAYLQQAIPYLKKAVEIHPVNMNAWLLMGNAYIKLKDYAASRACLQNCLNINPKHVNALNNLLYVGQVCNRDGIYNEALLTFRMLIAYDKMNSEYYYGLGLAFRGSAAFDSAIYAMNKAIEINPDNSDALAKLGEIYGQNLNRLEDSYKYFKKALAIKPDDASALENIGIVLAIKKDYAQSLEYFERALKLNPEKASIYGNMGQAYMGMGQKEKATECFNKATELQKKTGGG